VKYAVIPRAVLAFAVGAMAALPALPASAGDTIEGFSSPTRGIGCMNVNSGHDHYLRCDVVGGVVPLPPRPANCPSETGYGQGFQMSSTGSPRVVCAGDTSRGSDNVVPYGTLWNHHGFSCASSRDGMKCTNESGHGFFISRGDSRRF
jgi:hypothetical protein